MSNAITSLYCLSSDSINTYVWATVVSMHLQKRLYPAGTIVLYVDELTRNVLSSASHPLLKLADELICRNVPLPAARARSRFLKTTMRSAIRGDFVSVDADTLPIRPYHDAWEQIAHVAAALDRNRSNPMPACPGWIAPLYKECQWDFPVPFYFNSGVMFWRDTQPAHTLCEKWHENWLKALSAGEVRDQPSLNHTIHASGIHPHILDVSYNAMFTADVRYARDARILHFFLSQQNAPQVTLLDHLISVLRNTGRMDWEILDRAIQRNNPYVIPPDDPQTLRALGRWPRATYLSIVSGLSKFSSRQLRSLQKRTKFLQKKSDTKI